MALASVKINFGDGELGLVPSYPTGIPLFVGSASGTAEPNKVYHLTSDDPQKVIGLFGNSPLTNYILDAFSAGTGVVTALEGGVDQLLIDGNKAFEFIVLTDTADKTTFAAVNSYLTDLEQNKDVFTYALIPARGLNSDENADSWTTNLINEFEGVTSKRIGVVAGRLKIANLTGEVREDNLYQRGMEFVNPMGKTTRGKADLGFTPSGHKHPLP